MTCEDPPSSEHPCGYLATTMHPEELRGLRKGRFCFPGFIITIY